MKSELTTTIVKTKLLPPRIGSAPLRRGRILSTLESRLDRRLTLILGPAGSGKSTLTALWRQALVQKGFDVAWYNCGSDDDEAQFVTYLTSSFGVNGLFIGADSLDIYNRYGGKSLDACLAALINDINDYAKPLYLVLEDLHDVRSPAITRFLERLLALAPPNFRLIISSRVRPSFSLLPLTVQDQLTEISFVDLRFTYEESVQFLLSRGVDTLTAAQLHALHDLTDGWAAGLQLAAFSLNKSSDPDDYLRRIAASLTSAQGNNFHEYLHESITHHVDAADIGFLAKISACRRFNRELCELITGNSSAGELLARFESDNLFLIPIESDDATPWYRFHRLFAKFLNERLLQLPEDELKKLNQLASHWFGSKGLYVEAIRHAQYAGDEAFCIELIDRAARSTINSANFVALLKWVSPLPRDKLRDRLNLLLCIGWAQLCCGRLKDFDWTLDAILEHPGTARPGTHFEVELLQAFRLNQLDDTAGALALVAPYIARKPDASALSLILLSSIAGWALLYANRFEEARDVVRSGAHAVLPERPHRPSSFADAVIGVSFLVQGNLPQARKCLLRLVEDAARSAAMSAEVERYVCGYLAEVHFQLDELVQAERLLSECGDIVDSMGPTDSVLFACRTQAHLCRVRGRPEAGARILERLEEAARRRNADRITAVCIAEQIHLEVQGRQLSIALEAMQRLRPLAAKYRARRDCAFAEIPRAASISEAQIAAALGQHGDALKILEPLIAQSESRGRLHEVALLQVRSATSHAALGDRARSLGAAGKALRIASTFSMKRVFLDEGDAALELLRELQQQDLADAERQYVERALQSAQHACEPDKGATSAAGTSSQAASLSERELEILQLLAKAFSTKNIARTLNCSVHTVKWHLKNIYSKLGTSSREGAVVTARNCRIVI
ncbi:MAG: LuxR C-terminal-related transcriptional regulator [Sinimarinibacterium sp.]|jgi:LuxR family maltose regulon positive regulatory protein